ncbi:MAG: NUDIX domain-containing protein [Lachnospiraceae bacterium]|nr:NUDIX domain-containing protein [Lachnospiraceae bacterium]
MKNVYIKVKGIIKKDDRYLVLKRWVDDRIPDPFVWEFIDGQIEHGEAPDEGVLRQIREQIGVEGTIEKIEYTWSQMLGDTQCVGIAYLCSIEAEDDSFEMSEEYGGFEWIKREEFPYYIENRYVLNDLEKAVL